MSHITKEDIKKISRLARIEVNKDHLDDLVNQLNKVITWVEKLNEVDTDGVESLVNVNDMSLRLNEDIVSDGNLAQDILKNSKDIKYGYFSVPKVIE